MYIHNSKTLWGSERVKAAMVFAAGSGTASEDLRNAFRTSSEGLFSSELLLQARRPSIADCVTVNSPAPTVLPPELWSLECGRQNWTIVK